MRRLVVLALGFAFVLASMPLLRAAATGYHILNEIKIGGEGGWDYLTVDSAARRLYVSHATHVVVVDLDANKVVGDIPDTPGVHGIAIAPELNRGFISNGRGNNVTIFDLKTLKADRHGRHRREPGFDPLRRRIGPGVRLQRPVTQRDRDRREDRQAVAATIRAAGQAGVLGGRRQGQGLRQHRGHERDRRDRRREGDRHEEVRADRMRRSVGPRDRREEPPAVLRLRQPRDGGLGSRRRQGDRDAGDRRGLRRRRRSIRAPATRSARTATAR